LDVADSLDRYGTITIFGKRIKSKKRVYVPDSHPPVMRDFTPHYSACFLTITAELIPTTSGRLGFELHYLVESGGEQFSIEYTTQHTKRKQKHSGTEKSIRCR